MMRNNKIAILSIVFLMIFSLQSCVRDNFTAPPDDCNEASLTPNITVKELKDLYDGTQQIVEITEDYILEATVLSSDKEGNYYKSLVVQGEVEGIAISLDRYYVYNDYPPGQKIYVKCKGLSLGLNGGVVNIGSTYDDDGVIKFGRIQGDIVIDQHIIKSCVNEPITPRTIILDQVDDKFVNTLVKIENVQFRDDMIDTTFANSQADPPESYNLILQDLYFGERILRTSGYSAFAKDSVPKGSGTMIAVLGKYNGDYQFMINSPDDLDFLNERFTPVEPTEFFIPYLKDFEDQSIYSKGWTTQLVTGTINWELSTYDNFAQISNYNGSGNVATEAWYISPAFDLSEATTPAVSFDNAYNYSGPAIQVKYSTNYDGTSLPATATWTDLNPTLSNGNWNWVNTGDMELPTEQNVSIAIIYTGSTSEGSTWEIDNIRVRDISKK